MSYLQHALDYAAAGLPVLPCAPGTKAPLCEHGVTEATTDAVAVTTWWTRWPDAIIGATPPPDMVVIDVDCKDGIDKRTGLPRVNGLITWDDLQREHGDVITRTARTGGGGLHLWFRTTGWEHHSNREGRLRGQGIDVRGHGVGYVILPPSSHPSGTTYQWLDDAPVAECPDWLRLLIAPPAPPPAPPRPRTQSSDDFERAVQRFNDDHPIPFAGRGRGRCPVCDDSGSFGPLKGDTARWSCFSTDHPTDHGIYGQQCQHGDALDLACYARSLSRLDLLRQDGYLVARPVTTLGDAPAWIAEPDASAPATPAPGPPPWVTDGPEPEHSESVAHNHLTVYVLPHKGYAARIGDAWVDGDRAFVRALMVRDGIEPKAASYLIDALPPCGGFRFCPPSTEPVITHDGLPCLNLYRGIGIPADSPTTSDDFPAIRALLDHLLVEESPEYDDFLDWLAMPLQALASGKPGFRTQLSPILKGTHGAGKGFLCEILAQLYGEHYLAIGQEQLEDDFSPDKLEQALLVVIDELESPKKWNKFKRWVTEPRINLRSMRVASREVDVHFNLMMTSNLEKPVPVPEDDRRVYPIECPKKLPPAIMAPLVAMKRNHWSEVPAFHRFLLNRLVEFRVIEPRRNAARNALVAASRDIQTEFADELFQVGLESLIRLHASNIDDAYSGARTRWAATSGHAHDNGLVRTSVALSVVAETFRAYALNRTNLRNADPRVLWPILERRGCPRPQRVRRIDGNVCRVIDNLPAWTDAQADFGGAAAVQ